MTESKPIVFPCISAIFWILSLAIIGYAAPVFSEMYEGMGGQYTSVEIVKRINLFWTVPVGCVGAFFLIWISRIKSRKTNIICDISSIVIAVILFLSFVITAFCPVFAPSCGLVRLAEQSPSTDVLKAAPEE